MAMSSITVAGITPTLSILGSFQEFIYNQNSSAFRLYNTFTPIFAIPAETNFEYRNNTLSGFRWTHTTNTTDTIGQLKLQSFVLSASSGTDVLSVNDDNTIAFYSPVSIPNFIISNDLDMNNYKIIDLAEGTTGTDAVNLDQLNNVLNQAVLKVGSEMTGPLILSGDPVTSMQAATKNYVDMIAMGFDFKSPCYVATTTNLTGAYNNSAGVLINNGTFEVLIIDGIFPGVNSRVLVKDQNNPIENGIYVVNQVGDEFSAWILVRAADYNSPSEITEGNLVPVEYGTVNSTTIWLQTVAVTTIGTDPILFTQFTYGPSTFLQRINNLSDLDNTTTARLNLGLTDIAIQNVTENSVLIGGASNSIISLFGTTGQLLVANGVANPPSFQTYIGTNSITTVGTITSGTWNADIISPTYGGTGINNGIKTITLEANLVISGANNLTLATTGLTNVTLPVTGTLVNTDVTTLSSLSSIGTVTTGTWNANVIEVSYGGTGKSTLNTHSLLVGNGTSSVIELPVANTGTVLIGQTGSDPVFSTTPVVNSITINNDPVSSTDGVNKAYVDALTAGLDFKEVCYAATTTNLTAIYNNGVSGIGATLTNNGTLDVFSVDGQTPAINSRILVKNQTTTFQNGIYVLTNVGSISTEWELTRSNDYDSPKDITPGNLVPVEYGTVNSVSSWIQTSVVNIGGVGIDPITFTPFTYNPTSFLEVLNNLSDLNNASTARTNLGLTNVATQSVTNNNVLIGGASNSIVSLPLTNGQLVIGSTGNIPVAAVPSNGTNISWTIGAGSLTANITGQISLANGGTNANLTASNGGIVYSSASAMAILAGTATAGQILRSGTSAAPSWSTATYPDTTVVNRLLYSSATNVIGTLPTAANGVLVTSSGGIPSISNTLPSGVQTNITSLGTVTTGIWNGSTIAVNYGGTGVASTTAYGVICGGTTSTDALQNVGTGAAGQILTSNGPSALPSWQTTPSKSYGSMYRLSNTTGTSSLSFIICPGGNFTVGSVNNFTFSAKRLTYTGSTTNYFKLTGTSFETGNSGIKYYVFAKNGTTLTDTEMRVETTNQVTIGNITFTGIINLTTNDYIEVYVRTTGAGNCVPATITVVIDQVS